MPSVPCMPAPTPRLRPRARGVIVAGIRRAAARLAVAVAPRPPLTRRARGRGVIPGVCKLRDPRPSHIRCDMSGSLPAPTARPAASRGRAGRSARRESVSPHAPGLAWRHAMSAAPIAAYGACEYGRNCSGAIAGDKSPQRFRAHRTHRSRMRLMLAGLPFAFRNKISVIFLRFRGRINLDGWHVAMVGLLSCAVHGLLLLGCAASGDSGVPSSAGRCAGDCCRR